MSRTLVDRKHTNEKPALEDPEMSVKREAESLPPPRTQPVSVPNRVGRETHAAARNGAPRAAEPTCPNRENRHHPWRRRLAAAFGSLLLALAAPLAAQDTEGSTPPLQTRGTSHDSAVRFGALDVINLYNGNLSLTVPIGGSYPVGGSLSYGLKLIYNANAWDFQDTCEVGDPDTPGATATVYDAIPGRLSNAGLGWSLHFGRLLLPSHDIANPGLKVAYVAPDGSRHAFYDELRPGVAPGGRYTRDGSYIRWKEIPEGCFADHGTLAQDGCEVLLEFPDGSKHTMIDAFPDDPNVDFRTVRIEDRFGNAVMIDYQGTGNPGRSEQWVITDTARGADGTEASRRHTVTFANGREDRPLVPVGAPNAGNHTDGTDLPRIESVTFEAFGGVPATYSFAYQRPALPRHNRGAVCTGPNDPDNTAVVDAEVAVDLLTGIDLPAATPNAADRFAFGYYRKDGFDDGMKSGSLRSATLPTGGGHLWTYELWSIRDGGIGRNPSNLTYGVSGKYAFLSASQMPALDNENGQSIPALESAADGVWRYDHARGTDESGTLVISQWDRDNPEPTTFRPPCFYVTTVEDPAGQVVKAYHLGAKEGFHRAKALPFTPCNPRNGILFDVNDDDSPDVDVDIDPIEQVELGPRPTYYLSREIFDKNDLSTPLRREYVSYAYDDFPEGPPPFGMSAPKTRDYNSRVDHERTEYLDDPQDDGTPHFRSVVRKNFDGLGHFRLEERRSSFVGDGDQDTFTNYNPADCTSFPMVCTPDETAIPAVELPWVLETFLWREIIQQPESPNRTERRVTLTEFDPDTGFLKGQRKLLDATQLSDYDLLTCSDEGQGGHVVGKRFFGGDHQRLASNSRCSNTGLTPEYAIRSTYSYGSLHTSHHLDPDGNLFLRIAANEIDPSTGRVTQSEDTAGVVRSFFYDARGRLISTRPAGGAATFVDYDLGNAAGNTVTTRTCLVGGGGCDATTALTQSRQVYDGLGRRVLEKQRLPTASGIEEVERASTFDILGRPLATGVWTEDEGGLTTARTTYAGYDIFGRPGTITRPDNTVTTLAYGGDRWRSQTVAIETMSGPADSTRIEWQDGLGRLTVLEEPFLNTTYAYTPEGQLALVCVNDGNDNPRNCAGQGQRRVFEIDGRGLLVRERHPEHSAQDPTVPLDDLRSATLTYDARGNLTSQQTADSAFDLTYRYDPAGRITQIHEGAGDRRLLQENFYAPQSDADDPPDRRAGRLVQSKRHHWQGPGTDPSNDIVVTETFDYDAISGLATGYRVRSSQGPGFSSEIVSYDPLFNVTRLAYPECDRAPCSGIGGSRLVDYRYSEGMLSGISGFVQNVTYHRNGDLDRFVHANGTADRRILDQGWRLESIRVHATDGGGNDGAMLWSTGDFAYDAAGNIQAIGDDDYAYDLMGRLVDANVRFDGASARETIGYDLFGNITSMGHTGIAPPAPVFVVDSSTNRLRASAGFDYDARGNVTAMRLGSADFSAAYDALGQMRTFHGGSTAGGTLDRRYLYTAAGERFAILDDVLGDETYTPRAADNQVLRRFEKIGGAWFLDEEYVHAGARPVAAIDPAGAITHLHPDHLGSTRLVTRANGSTVEIIEENKYLPYGTPLHQPMLGDQALQFTGHERDAHGNDFAQDLDYMHARYFTPLWGRFLSVDAVLGSVESSQSWNRFSYVGNAPINYVDPNGDLRIRASVVLDKRGDDATIDGALRRRPQAQLRTVFSVSFNRSSNGFMNALKTVGTATGEKLLKIPGKVSQTMETIATLTVGAAQDVDFGDVPGLPADFDARAFEKSVADNFNPPDTEGLSGTGMVGDQGVGALKRAVSSAASKAGLSGLQTRNLLILLNNAIARARESADQAKKNTEEAVDRVFAPN